MADAQRVAGVQFEQTVLAARFDLAKLIDETGAAEAGHCVRFCSHGLQRPRDSRRRFPLLLSRHRFRLLIVAQTEKWTKVIRKANIELTSRSMLDMSVHGVEAVTPTRARNDAIDPNLPFGP